MTHRNQIFKMIRKSMIHNTQDWIIDNHGKGMKFFSNGYWVENKSLDIKAWVANGIMFFVFEKCNTNNFFSSDKIKFSVLQTFILYTIYLLKVRKLFFPILLLRLSAILFPLTPLLIYSHNNSGSKLVDLDISLEEKRDMILDDVLS